MSSSDDPHQAREASRYQNPIASREFITEALTKANGPLSVEALAEVFQYPADSDLFEGLRRRVGAMQRDGQLIINRDGGLMPVDEASLVAGRIQAHPDGFGFLIADDGDDDIYLSGKQMRQVLHGDRVVVGITGLDRRGRREGRIIDVVERAHTTLVGRFMEEQGVMHVSPDNKRIHLDVMIPVAGRGGAQTGDVVVVELSEQPTRRHPPVGKVIEVLGPELKAGMEIDVALRSHDIPHVWPEDVVAAADAYGAGVSDADIVGRKDVRRLPLMTIDGADARDFDDAVYAERTAKGFRLVVAIADVAHYVKPGSALDTEAKTRGTSVYFPGQVVPMLPEVLSNGLCSLNPHVDRLCMLCELTLDEAGGIKRTRFFNAVMHSHARLTYDEAWEMLSSPKSKLRKNSDADVVQALDTLYELYQVLRAARDTRGVIEFESTETRIVFDDERKISELLPVHRNDAHKLIEECMILANIAAASYVDRLKIPALYRVHQGPKSDRLEDLRAFLAFRDLKLGGGDSPTPLDYARLSQAIHDRADRAIVETTMLRSMQQAVYQPKNEGHFGLALNQYAHFTSPIRRYPDLLIHRAIRFALTRRDIEHYDYSLSDMQVLGESCSSTERRADEASRDVLSWLKCEYMQDHVGDEFDGVIATVTSFGLFVNLQSLHVEGLVHITSLVKDYYRFEPALGALVGEKSGREYHLGDAIRVRVAAVNLDERKIDFQEVDGGAQVQRTRSRSEVDDPTVRRKKPKKSNSQERRDKQRRKAKDGLKSKLKTDSIEGRKKKGVKRDTRKKFDAKKVKSERVEEKPKSIAGKSKAKKTSSAKVSGKKPIAKKFSETKRDDVKPSAKKIDYRKSSGKKTAAKKTSGTKFDSKKTSKKVTSSREARSKDFSSKKTASKKFSSKKASGKKVIVKRFSAARDSDSSVKKKSSSKKVMGKKPSDKKTFGKKRTNAKKTTSKQASNRKVSTKKATGKKIASKKRSAKQQRR